MTVSAEQMAQTRTTRRNDLPEGWASVPMKDCVDVLDHLRVPVNSEERKKRQGQIPYYGATGQVGWIDDYLFDEELLLLGEDGAPFFDKTRPISYIITGKSWVNNHAHVLRAIHGLTINQFLKFYVDMFDFADFVSGTTRLKLTQGSMKKIPVILPPLAEQKRIVAKVKELLARVNAARERLAKVPEILKRFRQSVLAAACSGELTADWRGKHPNVTSVKDIKDIIGRIQRGRIGQATTPAQKKKIEDIYSYEEREDSKLLPETWGYIALDKLCESFQYGTSKKSQPSGEIPVLRMGNIQNGEIDWSDLVYTSDSTEIQKYELDPGDVLFNRTNSPELVGKTAIYRGKQPAIFAGYLIRINNLEELDSRYLNCCLNSTYGREFCLKAKTDGVSQSNINAQKLGKFEVPFCCEEEQHEIVHRVEALFKVADIIENRVAVATAPAEKLTQAILAKAFHGELVPTEAELARREGRSYEPAPVLLERIRKAKGEARPRAKKTKKKEKGVKKMGKGKPIRKRRPIYEVLIEAQSSITPEKVFERASFTEDSVDEFYEELKDLVKKGTVRELRPSDVEIYLEAIAQ